MKSPIDNGEYIQTRSKHGVSTSLQIHILIKGTLISLSGQALGNLGVVLDGTTQI